MPISWGDRRLETPIARPSTPEEYHYASLIPLVEFRDHFEKYEKTSNEISRLRGMISTREYENDCDGVGEWEGIPMLLEIAMMMHETVLKDIRSR